MSVILERPDLPAPDAALEVPGPYLPLVRRLQDGVEVDDTASRLVDRALGLWTRPGFETFVSLPRLRFEPFDYQLRAAEAVLRRLRGRAILADEVGLGKTIEACLVLAELRLRGLAGRILALVPPGLVEQWREELERKFGLPSAIAPEGLTGVGTAGNPVLIASLATARRQPLRDALMAKPWDLVIVDEAHRCRNPRSASGHLVRSLRTRHLLLLTATPVENRLDDLFHLANLVSPGLLGSSADFRTRHREASGGIPRNLPALRRTLSEVMVRHRRSEVALMLPRRMAQTVVVPPGPERVRGEGRGARPSRALALLAAQRLAGSCPAVAGPVLTKLGWDGLAERAAGLGTTEKVRSLLGLLAFHRDRGDKVLVFTAFRRSLDHLARLAAAAGLQPAVYHGSLSRRAKEQAIADFRGEAAVLLSTEAAGEGRNLQFCHVMVNFDLPWNPMQIEQRLGRIHRIGQDHDVLLVNLVAKDSIEERILAVLEAKINLFELVIGELDMILGNVEEDFDFESSVFRAHVSAADDGEFATSLDMLGDALSGARRSYLASRARTDLLVDVDDEGGAR